MFGPLLILALLGFSPRFQEPLEDGAVAPPGRWITSGGSPARTGHSHSRPVLREPVVAWRVNMRGEIEGEPLVWDEKVVLSVRESAQRRAIHVLELETGRTLLHRRLPSTLPLEPAIWGDLLAVRPTSQRVDLYRMRGSRLLPLRTFRAVSSMSAPLLFGDELYLRVDGNLVRYDLDAQEEEWSTDGGGFFRGRPSLRGDAVYALGYEPNGKAHVARLRRSDGRLTARVPAGHHDGKLPEETAPAELYVHAEHLFIHYPLPVPSSRGPALEYGRLGRRPRGFTSGTGSLHAFLAAPLPWDEGWVVLESENRDTRWVTGRTEDGQLRLVVLADEKNHADLLSLPVAASRAQDVVYIGNIAAHLEDHRILWRTEIEPRFRPVPANGYVLMVEGSATIVALREPEPALDAFSAAARVVVESLEAGLAEGYASLAQKSLRVGDKELTARLLTEAVRLGARGRNVEVTENGLEGLATQERPLVADPRRLRSLLQEEEQLLEKPVKELENLARNAGVLGQRLAYVRALLELDPDNEAAAQLIRAEIPRNAPMAAQLDPRSWLDFLQVQSGTPLSFFRPSVDEAARLTPEFEALSREVERWRPDLDGYRSNRLFVITPPGRPGAVARCLEIGELVCDVLEEVLDIQVDDGGRDPLTLLLYDSQQQYIDQSRKAGSGPELALGWTAGHYSINENISRMFVPEDDDELHELLGVYAHELAHHWLATQAPFARRMPEVEQPGYWIAEGFAILVEEFVLDPRAGTWSPRNPRARSLDTVANATPDQLLSWERVFSLSFNDLADLSPRPTMSLPLTWRLGMRSDKSQIQMFYAQAGAACHYLMQLSPESRSKLVGYLSAWYAGDDVRTSVQWCFGMTPEELGEEVVSFARKAIRRH